jgi:hypothetical protein
VLRHERTPASKTLLNEAEEATLLGHVGIESLQAGLERRGSGGGSGGRGSGGSGRDGSRCLSREECEGVLDLCRSNALSAASPSIGSSTLGVTEELVLADRLNVAHTSTVGALRAPMVAVGLDVTSGAASEAASLHLLDEVLTGVARSNLSVSDK